MYLAFASIQFENSRRFDKNSNSCPKTCNKTVTWCRFYHTRKLLQTRKLDKSIFSMLFLKTFKDVKFTVDSSAFQTVNEKLLSNASYSTDNGQHLLYKCITDCLVLLVVTVFASLSIELIFWYICNKLVFEYPTMRQPCRMMSLHYFVNMCRPT